MLTFYLRKYWIVIGSILVGFSIRLWAGVHQPVYSEEAFSIFEVHNYPFPYDPSYPPLYPLFLTQWTKISTDLWWVRLPSILAGTAGILLFWRMIASHVNKTFANLGAILIALSSLHIHYSWVARPHAFMMYISILSLSQAWNIAETIRKKQPLKTKILILYLFTNTIGALLSHGYTMFLSGSLLALIIWAWQTDALSFYWKTQKNTAYILAAHILLPCIQLACILGRLQPLIDSAAWIPEFSIKSITSVLLTLTNTTKTLTGEMYTSALISIYLSLAVVLLVLHTLYTGARKKIPFITLLSLCVLITSIVSCAVVYAAFDMTVLQPRLLLSIHILYLLCLTVTLPPVFTRIRKSKPFSSAGWYKMLFIGIFLVFGARSLFLLNIHPYYNSPRVIEAIRQLKSEAPSMLLVFPRYEVITVKYLWGLHQTYPSLSTTWKLLPLTAKTPTQEYLHHIPKNIPIRILLLTPISDLSAGAAEIIHRLSPSCTTRHVDNIDILNCPPLTHEL